MRMAGVMGVGILAWGLGAQAQSIPPEGFLPWQDPAAVAAGEGLYAAHCAACHGAALEGAEDWQVRLPNGRMPAPPHDETGHTWHHADALLYAITAFGSEAVIGGGYESDMAGFLDTIGQDGVLQVLAYIKSTWPEEILEIHAQVNATYAAYGQD